MAKYNKKLKYKLGNNTHEITLYDSISDVGEDRLAVRDGSNTVYAAVGSIANGDATHFRTIKNGVTRAVLGESIGGAFPGYRGPGSQVLLKGKVSEGYFGTIGSVDGDYIEPWKVLNAVWGIGANHRNDLITQWNTKGDGDLSFDGGDNLATPWLKFAFKGKILFTPLRPLIHSVSWEHINGKGAVYGKYISINGINYKCRLLKGANTDPIGGFPYPTDLSEWDKLIYRTSTSYPDNIAAWDNFTNIDFGLNESTYRGTESWCQESSTSHGTVRGNSAAINTVYAEPKEPAHYFLGYRPCLELVLG